MIYRKLGVREIRTRPGRAILTLLSVVIGVAAVVAVTFASQSTRRAFDDVYASLAGRAALEVAAPIGESIAESVLPTVENVPGVLAAAPLLQRRTVMYVDQRRIQLVAMAIDPERDKAVHDNVLVAGKRLSAANGVLMNAPFAESVGVKLGNQIELLTRSGRVKTHVTGLYTSRGTATTGQGATMLMTLRQGQQWFRAPRSVDAIQIVLQPDANKEAVQAEIAKGLPEKAMVRRPAARSAMAEETALATDQALQMARAFSLLVAVFVITNTFLISVTQRRRQLGIMRAIGATRRQIAQLVYSEALLLGLAGTVLGSIAGVLAAQYLTDAMGTLYETKLPPIHLTPAPFVWAFIFGMGISLAGAALPAFKAAHLSPLDAIRDVLPSEIEGFSRWLVLLGGAIVVACGGVMVAGILGKVSVDKAVWSSALLLVGLVFLLPLALEPLARGVAAILPASMRIEGRLASRQLLIHRSRTTLTVGVVFIATSAALGLANTVIDNVEDVRSWYRQTVIADFFVRATAPDMATGLAADLPDELDPKIRAVPGIKAIDAARLVSAKAAGQQVILIVRGFADPELQEFDLVHGDPQTVRDQLKQGEVVLGSVFAERTKLKPGDEVTLETDKGEKEFRVAGVANDYQAGGLTMYMDREVAKRELEVGGVDAYLIKVQPEQREQVHEALKELTQPYGLMLQSFTDIQRDIDAMMAGVNAGLWGMVALGLLVATFGVANTLTMSVLEQTFELGLLRVIATTRSQVRKIVFAQALIIGLLALAPGIVAGVIVAYLINLATMPVIGHPVEFAIHPLLLAGALLGGLIVVLAAAWGPAERAARVELPTVLRLR